MVVRCGKRHKGELKILCTGAKCTHRVVHRAHRTYIPLFTSCPLWGAGSFPGGGGGLQPVLVRPTPSYLPKLGVGGQLEVVCAGGGGGSQSGGAYA